MGEGTRQSTMSGAGWGVGRIRRPEGWVKRKAGCDSVVCGPRAANTACCEHLLAGGDRAEGFDLALRDVSSLTGLRNSV